MRAWGCPGAFTGDVRSLKQRTGASTLPTGTGAKENSLPQASRSPGGARRRRLAKGPTQEPTQEPGPAFRCPRLRDAGKDARAWRAEAAAGAQRHPENGPGPRPCPSSCSPGAGRRAALPEAKKEGEV